MNEFKNMMRRMRRYVADVETNNAKRADAIKALETYKGSEYYRQQIDALNKNHEAERIKLAKDLQEDLINRMETMRANVRQRITAAPTADMVNTINMLRVLDNVTPAEMRQYAITMADCPIAMKSLKQIARDMNINIQAPDADSLLNTLDNLEGYLALFLRGFRGKESMTPSIMQLYDYFLPDDQYTSRIAEEGFEKIAVTSEYVDMQFWKRVSNGGDPLLLEMIEAPDKKVSEKDFKIKYFFRDIDGLNKYIEQRTEGLEGKDKEDKVNEILNNCPGQYGAAYRYYKMHGEKVALIDSFEDEEEEGAE